MILKLDLDDLREHPEIVEQIRVAVAGAACRPEFLRALLSEPGFRQLFKEALTPEQIWLSYAQVQDFLDLPRSTFFDWKKRNAGKLVISLELGPKDPRIKLSSILALMEAKAISAAPLLPGISALPSKPASTDRRSRLPAAALRDVALMPQTA